MIDIDVILDNEPLMYAIVFLFIFGLGAAKYEEVRKRMKQGRRCRDC